MTDGAPKPDQSKELSRNKVHFEVKGHIRTCTSNAILHMITVLDKSQEGQCRPNNRQIASFKNIYPFKQAFIEVLGKR